MDQLIFSPPAAQTTKPDRPLGWLPASVPGEQRTAPSFDTADLLARATMARFTQGVSPWRSVYKLHLFTDNELTFVLTNGGHNAGIILEPGHRGRRYHSATRHPGDHYVDSDRWLSMAVPADGSWWPAWAEWLERHGSPERATPPSMGAPERGLAPLWPAPGIYVQQRQ
jgi:poly(3-hydroxyalkanoate) synthetase